MGRGGNGGEGVVGKHDVQQHQPVKLDKRKFPWL